MSAGGAAARRVVHAQREAQPELAHLLQRNSTKIVRWIRQRNPQQGPQADGAAFPAPGPGLDVNAKELRCRDKLERERL